MTQPSESQTRSVAAIGDRRASDPARGPTREATWGSTGNCESRLPPPRVGGLT
jgi:hypothetical protein